MSGSHTVRLVVNPSVIVLLRAVVTSLSSMVRKAGVIKVSPPMIQGLNESGHQLRITAPVGSWQLINHAQSVILCCQSAAGFGHTKHTGTVAVIAKMHLPILWHLLSLALLVNTVHEHRMPITVEHSGYKMISANTGLEQLFLPTTDLAMLFHDMT